MTINKDRVELFVAALESGDYTQCVGNLRRENRVAPAARAYYHCALGVATDVALNNGLREELDTEFGSQDHQWVFNGGSLTQHVMHWYGFTQSDPWLIHSQDPEPDLSDHVTVSDFNDHGTSFWDIAQMGRARWLKDQE